MDEVRVFCGDVDRPTLIDESTILLDVAATKGDPARVDLNTLTCDSRSLDWRAFASALQVLRKAIV